MYYFVSSWYSKEHRWHAVNQPWYQQGDAYEFDDTVNQLRMFRSVGENVTLLTLSYAPNLRRFLHREGIYPIRCWSAFDELQDIHGESINLFSYEDIDWPEYTESVLTAFCRCAYVDNRLYAIVEFGEDGNMVWTEYYKDDRIVRRDLYDDRGFLSSRIHYENEQPRLQEYYNRDGICQFTEDYETGAIQRAPGGNPELLKETYENIEELMTDVLRRHAAQAMDAEMVVIASNAQHNQLIFDAIPGGNIALSFFETRFDLSDTEALSRDLSKVRFVVADTEHTAKLIRSVVGEDLQIYDISPFDTRLSLGKSQRIKELKVLMPLDGLEGILLEKAMTQVFEYMVDNQNVELLIGTKKAGKTEMNEMRESLHEILVKLGLEETLRIDGYGTDTENGMEANRTVEKSRIFMSPYLSETDLIRILYDTRLILDVRDQPDLYLQIAGISAGIPQVNYRFTRYVEHQKDGYIIQNINYITGALEYYLSGLAHWNEALVYCVQEIAQYTGGSLVKQWKKLAGIV